MKKFLTSYLWEEKIHHHRTRENVVNVVWFCKDGNGLRNFYRVPRNPKGFPDSSVGKESTSNAGDPDLIPGSGRSSGDERGYPLQYSWASLVAQLVKNPPAMWESWVWSLGWEDPLEKGMLPTPVLWPGEFHGLYSPRRLKELDKTERLSLSLSEIQGQSRH